MCWPGLPGIPPGMIIARLRGKPARRRGIDHPPRGTVDPCGHLNQTKAYNV
jgi:hypothetical protein